MEDGLDSKETSIIQESQRMSHRALSAPTRGSVSEKLLSQKDSKGGVHSNQSHRSLEERRNEGRRYFYPGRVRIRGASKESGP